MKFFADTANLEEIAYCFSRKVDDGITTNPKIMETTGDLSLGFEGACKSILQKYPNVPVSLETDLRGIDPKKISETEPEVIKEVLLRQAEALSSWGKNVIVKIPVCAGGLLAAEELARRGVQTNITACMTPYQALAASKSGIGYVSLFANRMLDGHILSLAGCNLEESLNSPNWKNILKENKDKYFLQAWGLTLNQIAYVAEEIEKSGRDSALIVGSIRCPEDIHRIAKARPQVITIPTGIVRGLPEILGLKSSRREISPTLEKDLVGKTLTHPMTQYTLEEFEKAADSYRKSG